VQSHTSAVVKTPAAWSMAARAVHLRACTHLKGQLLQGGTGFQALKVADLIVSKARLAQASELLQPLNAPQAMICHAQLHNMTPPCRWLRACLPICSVKVPSQYHHNDCTMDDMRRSRTFWLFISQPITRGTLKTSNLRCQALTCYCAMCALALLSSSLLHAVNRQELKSRQMRQ